MCCFIFQIVFTRDTDKDLKMLLRALLKLLIFTGKTPFCLCANATILGDLYTSVFTGYNRKALPVIASNDTVHIQIGISLMSLNNFEVLSGQIDATMVFGLWWQDERLSWDPATVAGVTSMVVFPEDIWKPQLIIRQSSNKIQDICNASLMLRVDSSGQIIWNPGHVLQVSCSIDVEYFPFDIQKCSLTISPYAYTSTEVHLFVEQVLLDTTLLSDNSQWEVLPSPITNETLAIAQIQTPSGIKLELILKRKSAFFIVYLLVPILVLAFINNLVFSMPASSGERTSVAVTTFLSFVVYMGILNDVVPESSSPISFMYFYLLVLIIYSALIMLLCIISLRMYDKSGDVPLFLQTLVKYLRFWNYRRKRPAQVDVIPESLDEKDPVQVLPESLNDKESTLHADVVDTSRDGDVNKDETEKITWVLVGKTFDLYVSVILYIAQGCLLLYSMLYLRFGSES